jgi:hypothetical protein
MSYNEDFRKNARDLEEERQNTFPSCISIIEKFIQSEIDKNNSSNEYILALNECTTLEDLVYEVGGWKNPNIIENYGSVSHYILMSLDKEYD